ncbi:MAG TPA: response regulator [Burkholderiales bacterium]|nr:response regulator [Burkholderiales bacterium]
MNDNDDKVNILLVDDQPQRLLSYEAILGTLGENLVKARSGTEALQRLMEADFAAILLDVNMPTMNGFDTAALIHQHPRFEKTPIIFVTAVHVTNLDQLKGYELGAVDYCYVPIVPEVLRGKVQVLVELYRKRRELERANEALALANTTLQAEKTRELEEANAELAKTNDVLEREITERKRFEQELQEADRRKDEFLAMLSHELRNPLAAISNVAHVMKASPAIDPQLRWARDVLGRQTGHLTRLIDDLLDVSRITRGKVTLRREPLELKSVVAAAVETTRTLITQRGHALQVDVPEEAIPVLGDRVRLTQVVDNVLTNAAKYTQEGGRITVALEIAAGTPGEALIRVRDTGVGIAAEMLPNLFQLFRRADDSLARSEGGLGIGLALARGLIEMHGGRIEAFSDGPGKGSEFVIRLPRANGAIETPEAQPRQAPLPCEQREDRQLKVLVVDDSVDSAESMAIILEMSGHSVRKAHNGPDALRAASEYRPDVVLMDIGMPGMSGHEVAQKLRETPAMREVVLIAMTGYGRQVDREQSRAAGFDHHLVKPLDFDKLNEVLIASSASRRRAPAFVRPQAGNHTSLGVR